MAGLDPAAVATKSLVDQLLERKDEQTGRISVDSLMKVALHFKDTVSQAYARVRHMTSYHVPHQVHPG